MRNSENMENTLKIKVFRKSILFCKYLRNGSSDLYEIVNLSPNDSSELPEKNGENWSMFTRAQGVNACTLD